MWLGTTMQGTWGQKQIFYVAGAVRAPTYIRPPPAQIGPSIVVATSGGNADAQMELWQRFSGQTEQLK